MPHAACRTPVAAAQHAWKARQSRASDTLPARCPRREAALAWEAAFLKLAADELAPAVQAAGLALSFSTERSVADELRRESGADAPTVALSYLVRRGLDGWVGGLRLGFW
jgi:hypothetical protein